MSASEATLNATIRLHTMAAQLARVVETLDGLTPGQRCDLRHYPCELLAVRDMLLTDYGDAVRQPRGPRLAYSRDGAA